MGSTFLIIRDTLGVLSLASVLFLLLVPVSKTGAGLTRVFLSISSFSFLLWILVKFWGSATDQNHLLMILSGVILFSETWLYVITRSEKRSILQNVLEGLLPFLLLYTLTMTFPMFSFVTFLGISLMLGILLYAMILGHWYLVVPKLSEQHLLTAMKIFWGLFFVKGILFSLFGLLSGYFPGLILYGLPSDLPLFEQILYWMHLLWGDLGLLVLGIFTWKLVKMRSIQSATGVLYVMVCFGLVGEILALYFAQKWKIIL